MDELCNPNTWYLVDAQVPMAHCAITLETSVPEWSKTGVNAKLIILLNVALAQDA